MLRNQERWPSVDVVQLEVVKGVPLCLHAGKIPSLWRSIGLHTRLHLHVDVGVHAGSGSGTVRKTPKTSAPYGCEWTRSWCAVINVNCVVARVVGTVRFQVAVSTWLLYRTFVLTPVRPLKARLSQGLSSVWRSSVVEQVVGHPRPSLSGTGYPQPGPTGVVLG